MRKFFLALMGCLFCMGQAISQGRTVSGTVYDDKNDPVSFATITEVGTKRSVQADANGTFNIRVSGNARLAISAAGFTTITINADAAQRISMTRSGNTQLSEVVVTALGIQRQAKDLGYATTKIRSSELTQARAVNLQQGLAGKVSGLNITTTNSGVFENTKINLRGLRSLTGNNQPLLVIDGIPTPINYISSLNPNDVADVTLLKGASSAAIYGPDGVNGVIVITTKKGTRGKPVVTFSSSYQFNRVAFMPKRQFIFGTGSSVDANGQPIYDPFENFSYGDAYDGSMRGIGKELEDGDLQTVKYAPLDDEQKKFWNGNGSVLQNDISFSTQDYYISVQDARIHGLMPKDVNRRTSMRFNASKDYGKFKSSINLNYIQSNFNIVDEPGIAGRFPAYNGSIYSAVLQSAAHIPLSSYKDWRNSKYAQYSNYYNEYAVNPYWAIDNHRSVGRNDDLIGSLDLKYEIASWLQATGRVGTNITTSSFKNSDGPITVTDFAKAHRSNVTYNNYPGSVVDGFGRNSRLNAEFFLSGKRAVRDFGVNYVLGTQFRQNDGKNLNVTGNNLVVPNVFNVSNRTGEAISNESNFRNRLISVFGSLGFNYKGWANIEVVGRNDWDTKLHPDANSYFYPAVSGAVILSDAVPALKNSSLISYAKIRGSVAKSGNVNLGTYALQATYGQSSGFPYGGLAGFTSGNLIPDRNIRPEFVKSKEVGLELGFLKNKANLEATYFHQSNTDQILTIQQSVTTGYSQVLANTADFDNYGVELDLRLTPLVTLGKAKLDLKINATYNENKIIKLSDDINELAIGGSTGFVQLKAGAPNAINYAIVGHPAFVFKLSDYKRDPNGRVIVDATTGDPSLSDSLVTRGRTQPLWILGFNPSFSFKNLSIGMTWDYKGGHYAYHGLGTDMDGYGVSARSAQFNRERFVFPNSVYYDGTKYIENRDRTISSGHSFWGNNVQNTQVATNYFTSAAAWKLRELAIGYDLPAKLLGEGKIVKKATISAIARNLIILVPKSNQWSDPEFNSTPNNANPNTLGVGSVFSTPPSRIFGGSVTLTF
ncbi:MAG TPA: SusC/RagA family TonB-linked outer membrane protein [Flavisolibacter sp.]|nr:SusC/RagA family TonB-linked outer membrane protein [Flavisolibacter sp.]